MNHMDPIHGANAGRKPRWSHLLLGVAAIAIALFLVWLVWLPSQLGDPAKETLVVTNRTDAHLRIVQIDQDGSGSQIAAMAPRSSVETYLPCAAAPLEAIDPDGTVVARRPGSEECNLADWVIG